MIRPNDPLPHVIVGPRALDECGPFWAALASELDVPVFQRLEWARIWMAHFGQDAEPWIVVRQDSTPYLWPLVLTRIGPYRVLRSLGEGVSDYLGPLSADPRSAALDAARVLLRAPSFLGHIDLKSVYIPADALDALEERLGGGVHRVYERCPYIQTDGTFAKYLEGRKKKFRANWKRTIRRTESHGNTEIGIARFDDRLFRELESVERESWKWAEGSAYLGHAGRHAFLREVLSDPTIESEIWTCRVEGVLAAFAVTFRNRRTRHYYLPSFRSRFTDVGTYLMGKIAEATFDSELQELDLLQGDESYKLAWSTGERAVYEIGAPGRGPLGWPALLALRSRWRLAGSRRLRSLRSRLQRAAAPRLETGLEAD